MEETIDPKPTESFMQRKADGQEEIEHLQNECLKLKEARSLLRAFYKTDADLLPDHKEGTLMVRLHHMANRSSDVAITELCEQLDATETKFPGTDLRLLLKPGADKNLRDQVV